MRKQERLLTKVELEGPITSKTFFRRAQLFIEKNLKGQSLPVIRSGTDGWNAWREYFERHLHWTPVVMRKLIDNTPDKPLDGMTVPTLYPQHFDGSFRELDGWEPPLPKRMTKRLSHETLAELRRRYGPAWGVERAAGDDIPLPG